MPSGIYIRSKDHGKHVWEARKRNGTTYIKGTGKKAWNTRRLNDPDNLSAKKGSKKAHDVRKKNDPNNLSYKKVVETRRLNGTNHNTQTSEGAKKGWKIRKINDPNNDWTKRGVETRRKNGTLKHTEETKDKLKIIGRRRTLKNGQMCNIGNNETKLLDEEQKKLGNYIYRQYYIYQLGYTVDGYDPFLNIVYEVYEKKHKYNIEKDLIRQKQIEKCLKCKFIIIQDENV